MLSLFLRSLPFYLFFVGFFVSVGIYGFYLGFSILTLFCLCSFVLFHIEAKRRDLGLKTYFVYMTLLPGAANFVLALFINSFF